MCVLAHTLTDALSRVTSVNPGYNNYYDALIAGTFQKRTENPYHMLAVELSDYLNSIHYRDSLRLFMNKIVDCPTM